MLRPFATRSIQALAVMAAVGLTMCSSDGDGDDASGSDGGAGQAGILFGDDSEDTALLPDGGVLGTILPDGAVIDDDGTVIGSLQDDGTVTDSEGNVIGAKSVGLGTTTIGDCAAEIFAGETIPVDIYIMFDQSGSMVNEDDTGTARLDAVRSAIGQFMQDPASRGLGLGIGYFGKIPLGEALSCDTADYADPAVTIDQLPDNATAITSSLNGIAPTGETPTGAAIRGACQYTQGWASANPAHAVVILLVTDGVPEAPISSQAGGCDPTLADAVDAATDCRSGSPGIQTHVLGVGPSLSNLNQIASAGGTDQAYLVEGGDVATEVLQALNTIRGNAVIPCEFEIPDAPAGQTLSFDKVNALYTDSESTTDQLLYVGDETSCSESETGGWFYDDENNPTKILLCDSTCDTVKQPGGLLSFALGCDRVELVR